MDVLHERVEMDPLFVLERTAVEEHVHEHGLPSANCAVQVDA